MIKNKAQSLTEYSICLAIVLIALISMNFYVKRGLQGRYKDGTDYAWAKVAEIVKADSTLTEERKNKLLEYPQYEPDYKESEYTNALGRKIIGTTISVGGNFRRDLPAAENYMTAGGTSKDDASAKEK